MLTLQKFLSYPFFGCRRGSRTAHGAVSHKAKFWWSTPVDLEKTRPALLYVYPELTTPETGGHGCQFRHPTV